MLGQAYSKGNMNMERWKMDFSTFPFPRALKCWMFLRPYYNLWQRNGSWTCLITILGALLLNYSLYMIPTRNKMLSNTYSAQMTSITFVNFCKSLLLALWIYICISLLKVAANLHGVSILTVWGQQFQAYYQATENCRSNWSTHLHRAGRSLNTFRESTSI